MVAALLSSSLLAVSLAGPKEPKPAVVAYNPEKAPVQVFKDAADNTYVVVGPNTQGPSVFVGKGKQLYQQSRVLTSRNGDSWSFSMWTPRVPEFRDGYIKRESDGTYTKSCWGADDAVLTEQTGEKAKAILEKSQFMSPFSTREGHLLARDDAGIYYYVDKYTQRYGGNGYRVFVGRKGAMKQLPLIDIANDTAGQVFSTKTGQLRLVLNSQPAGGRGIVWVKGQTRNALINLNVDDNGPLVYSELGLYGQLGTICDNI